METASSVAEEQRDIVDFLSAPGSHDGSPVERIDTHLSHVFLTDRRAYKLKRAIRYDFADFSTVERRRAAGRNEIDVNRRTAEKMYLGLRPLYRSEGRIGWRADGEPVDWVVEMARFDADDQFDRLLARGALDASTIETLADRIADFHREAEIRTALRAGADIGEVLKGVAAGLRAQEIATARADAVALWERRSRAAFETSAALIAARRRHGWVRRCHGDLHLANICLFDGEPTPFDAIEFSEDLATIDVLYDLAFVLMDLMFHRRKDLANLLLNRYLGATRDYRGLELLPLFLSLRAGVRARVKSLPVQDAQSHAEAEEYLDLALTFLEVRSGARLIAVSGFSGVGKSTLARRLAAAIEGPFGAVVLRSDVARKRLEGVAPERKLDPAQYDAASAERVYARLMKDARRAMAAGHCVILDASFLEADFRDRAARLARSIGAPFHGLWLTAPRDVLARRIAARRGDASDATVEVLEAQMAQHEPPTDWTCVDAGAGAEESCRRALQVVQGARR